MFLLADSGTRHDKWTMKPLACRESNYLSCRPYMQLAFIKYTYNGFYNMHLTTGVDLSASVFEKYLYIQLYQLVLFIENLTLYYVIVRGTPP